MSRVLRIAAFVGCLAGCWLAAEGMAEAQNLSKNKIDVVRPELHLSLGPGFGTGFQVEIPIVPDGFLKGGKVEDELALVPGFEFFFVDFDNDRHFDRYEDRNHFDPAFGPYFVAMWNVYVHEQWSVFPELGLTVMIVEDDWIYYDHDFNDGYDVYVAPVIGGGARWHFTDRNALVFRLVFPYGFQFGITF